MTTSQQNGPVMLAILDGFGLAPESKGNAVALANTPNFDTYRANYPFTELQASGKAVGLPVGQMGNSEVGHLNIGAGRIVMQSLSFIQEQLDSGEFATNKVFNKVLDDSNTIHLMGLVSDGGVHSDIDHLFGLLDIVKQNASTKKCYIHVFTDGRDTAPHSGLGFIEQLQTKLDALGGNFSIASVSGRYFAMDRDNRWERVQQAYDAIVAAQAKHSSASAVQAIQAAYDRGETDEFIQPTIIKSASAEAVQLEDNDGVFFFNFRADRARELSYALLGDASWSEFERSKVVKLNYASLMKYDSNLDAPFALEMPQIKMPLAEVLALAGKKQYHTAETEKYPHVTFFFNAQVEDAFSGESRHIEPSPKDVKTYDLKPEMSAVALTEATLDRVQNFDDDFLLINFANPDMVGHTGVIEAAVKACEVTDKGLGILVDAVLAKNGQVIVIADHGNAEQMLDADGNVHTAHTTNPVPCLVIGAEDTISLRDGGILGDVAPTVLELLGIAQPDEMTGKSLIVN